MDTLGEFLNNWLNHTMKTGGRNHLEMSDIYWEEIYKILLNGENLGNIKLVDKDTQLFRVHRGLEEKPSFEKILEEVEDPEEAREYYESSHEFWRKGKEINFNNNWLSFTKSVDTIGSSYFGGKQLRGDVIVLSSDRAIDISEEVYENLSFEKEVVAPLSELNLIEVIPFKDFIEKYGKGTSDYEKRNKK